MVQTYKMIQFELIPVNGEVETHLVYVDGLFPMAALAHLIDKRNINLNDYTRISFVLSTPPLVLSNEEARQLHDNIPYDLKYDEDNVVSHNQPQRWTTIKVGCTEYVVDRNDLNRLIDNAESSIKIENVESTHKVNITFKE